MSSGPVPTGGRHQPKSVVGINRNRWSASTEIGGRLRRNTHPTDLTKAQWELLEPLIPPAKPGGRPREVDMRAVLNAIFYLLRTGCQWRFLPRDFPPWTTVYTYFRNWRNDGTWPRLHDALRDRVRQADGREVSPSAAIIDSQSVKTTEKGDRAATMRARK
jgi:putative transposase